MKNIISPNGRILEPLLPIKEGMENSTLSTSKAIIEGVDKLIAQGRKPALSLEIVSGNQENIGLIKDWIGFSDDDVEPGVNVLKTQNDSILAIRYHLLGKEKVTSSGVGSDYTDIKIVDFDYVKETFGEEALESQMYFYASDPCLMYVFLSSNQEISKDLKSNLESLVHKLVIIDDIQDKGCFLKFVSQGSSERFLNSLYNFGLSKSAESIQTLLELSLEQEKRSLKGKKVMNNQKIIEIKNTKEGNERELNTDLRKYVTFYTKALFKGTEEHVEKNVSSRSSRVQNLAESYGSQLSEFEESKNAKEIILRIPESLKSQYLSDVKESLLQTGQENLMTINDSLKELKNSVEEKVSQSGHELNSLNVRYLSDIKLKEIINESVHWERDFEGNLPKKGAYEYFMAARKFQMILFMVASSFGLSFMRDLKLYMIPLTIILLGFGAISIHKSVQKERKEKMDKEKKKAQDLFKNEAKKHASDFTRSWMKYLKDGIDGVEQQTLNSVEEFLKLASESEKKKLDEAKSKVQSQAQNLDDTERRHQNMERAIENIKRSLGRLKDDYQREIKAI